MSEGILIDKVKTSFRLIVIMLIGILIMLGFMSFIFFIMSIFLMFLAILLSSIVIFIFFAFFWRRSFSTKIDETEIVEVINKYIKKVKPCLFIGLIALIGLILSMFLGGFLSITYFYRSVLNSIFIFFILFNLMLYFLGSLLKTNITEIRDPVSNQKEILKKKLKNHLKERWKNDHNPTLENLKNSLNLSNERQISLLYDTLSELFSAKYLDCVYDDKNSVCYTKKSSIQIWIILIIIFAPWIVLIVLIILYPDLASMTLWRSILLFSNGFIFVLLLIQKKNSKKREEEFSQMHPEYFALKKDYKVAKD